MMKNSSLRILFFALATACTAPAAETWRPMYGVNLAGGDFGTNPGTYGYDYIYPRENDFKYYAGKGLTFVRIPFKWERVQRTLNAALDETEMGRLDTVLGYASKYGVKVLLDMHNYNERKVSGTTYQIGSTQVPHTALGDGWYRIAGRYKDNTAVYGYDIMNEPKGTLANWQAAAQVVVNQIRRTDSNHFIFVEGVNWAGAQSWASSNSTLNVTDSANMIVYSAHSYWDSNHDGGYGSSEVGTATSGVNSAKPFIDWLAAKGARGHIGEYGTPKDYNVASWNTALDGFLAHLKSKGISGTYWAAWPVSGWGTYQLSCAPDSTYTTDAVQMPILQKYGQASQAESLAYTATGATSSVVSDSAASGGKWIKLNGDGVGDYIQFTVPVTAGFRSISIRYKTDPSRGKIKLRIVEDNSLVGSELDQYSATNGYFYQTIGTKTFTATGNKTLRFEVSGKNASSSSYTASVDTITVQ